MPDNAREIIDMLRGRILTQEEADRIIEAVRQSVREEKPEGDEYDAHGIKRGVINP
jgi:hypothetical protein